MVILLHWNLSPNKSNTCPISVGKKITRTCSSDLCKKSLEIWLKILKLHYFILGLSSFLQEGTVMGHVKITCQRPLSKGQHNRILFCQLLCVRPVLKTNTTSLCLLTFLSRIAFCFSQQEIHFPKGINYTIHFFQ